MTPRSKSHPRRQAREGVLKALYALEITHEQRNKVLADILAREAYGPKTEQFVEELYNSAVDNRQWAEEKITRHLENWEYNRVALLDQLILRMSVCELYYMEDVPPKVSISEAIEIAKEYSTEDSSSFVNGILDAVYKEMKKELQS